MMASSSKERRYLRILPVRGDFQPVLGHIGGVVLGTDYYLFEVADRGPWVIPDGVATRLDLLTEDQILALHVSSVGVLPFLLPRIAAVLVLFPHRLQYLTVYQKAGASGAVHLKGLVGPGGCVPVSGLSWLARIVVDVDVGVDGSCFLVQDEAEASHHLGLLGLRRFQ